MSKKPETIFDIWMAMREEHGTVFATIAIPLMLGSIILQDILPWLVRGGCITLLILPPLLLLRMFGIV